MMVSNAGTAASGDKRWGILKSRLVIAEQKREASLREDGPAIYSKIFYATFVWMDCRVKPANDGSELIDALFRHSPRRRSALAIAHRKSITPLPVILMESGQPPTLDCWNISS
jgi:hypothetical protein